MVFEPLFPLGLPANLLLNIDQPFIRDEDSIPGVTCDWTYRQSRNPLYVTLFV